MEKPLVGVIMGSRSDWETMHHTIDTLTALGIPHESRVVSAHRTPDLLFDYARSAEERGIEVIIAGAGGAGTAGDVGDQERDGVATGEHGAMKSVGAAGVVAGAEAPSVPATCCGGRRGAAWRGGASDAAVARLHLQAERRAGPAHEGEPLPIG